jgi:hypothetical protein
MVDEFAGGNRSEFARTVGNITSTAIGDIIVKGAVPSGETLRRTLEAYPVEAHWLLTGEPPMRRRDRDKLAVILDKFQRDLDALDAGDEG